MREILFRGKRVDNGEWVYGHYGKYMLMNGESVPCISTPNKEAVCGNICYDVEASTVEQYTGLTDKNGKKIFEGDILEDTYGNETYRDVVVANRWNCSCCDGVYGYAFEHHAAWLDFRDIESCTVVGNVHDNPELLEVEE